MNNPFSVLTRNPYTTATSKAYKGDKMNKRQEKFERELAEARERNGQRLAAMKKPRKAWLPWLTVHKL